MIGISHHRTVLWFHGLFCSTGRFGRSEATVTSLTSPWKFCASVFILSKGFFFLLYLKKKKVISLVYV